MENPTWTVEKCGVAQLYEFEKIRKLYFQHLAPGYFETMMRLDGDGFFLAKDESGKIVGTVAICNVSDDCSIKQAMAHAVLPDLRGKGIGTQLWKFAFEKSMTERQNAFLVCGLNEMRLYKNILKFGSTVAPVTLHYVRPGKISLERLSKNPPLAVSITPFNRDDHFEKLSSFDSSVAGYGRSKLLDLVTKEAQSETLIAIKETEVVGYAVLSTDVYGFAYLRFVFADTQLIAEVLIYTLLANNPSATSKGVTGLLLTGHNEKCDIAERLGVSTIPMVNILYRLDKMPNAQYSKQFVVPC